VVVAIVATCRRAGDRLVPSASFNPSISLRAPVIFGLNAFNRSRTSVMSWVRFVGGGEREPSVWWVSAITPTREWLNMNFSVVMFRFVRFDSRSFAVAKTTLKTAALGKTAVGFT